MQNNARKADQVRPGPSRSGSAGETKQVRKSHTRKIPYRVGYSWNKGGRLKELRIRHLARKFLKIWIHNTFGRILPHEAKQFYNGVLLRRAFRGWTDEWWTSRREWSLTVRAECHYRYYLYHLTFHSWRSFVSLQREEKRKVQTAQSFADRRRMCLAWDGWEVFTEMKRIKNRMLVSALEQNRLATLHSAWSLWKTRLQQHQDFHALEDRALKRRELTLQRRAWLQWREMHAASRCLKEKESKAAHHFILRLKRKTLHRWKSYVSRLQAKKKSQAVAQSTYHLRLLNTCWKKWSSVLQQKWSEEDRLQAARHLAVQSTRRRALERWKAYVTLCREEDEKSRIASQHHHHHLLSSGLRGLSLNVIQNRTNRLNNNVAVQHYHQTMTSEFWRLWKERLEEAEDKSFQPLRDMAVTKHSTSLTSSCLHHWRERLAEQRRTQELERRADIWFAEHMLPRCFNSWIEFTLQRRLQKQRRHKADVYNKQRQYTWVFYTWFYRWEKHREQLLSERMAILHEERRCLQRTWDRWSQRTEQQIIEEEKQEASERLYLHRLLHRTMTQWKDNSAEIRDRRNRELQAHHQGDLRRMRRAVEKWKKFVRSRRAKKYRLRQMQRYHDVKLLRRTFLALKTHRLQMSQICGRAEELHRQQEQNFLRKVLCVWRENAVLLAEVRLTEQRAQNHFQRLLQFKVFLAWREVTTRAVSKRRQQGEAISRAQMSINQVRLLQSFRQWREETRAARRERRRMEKARQHDNCRLLSKALNAWNKHHHQYLKNKVMKRQGLLLLRLKMYQTYFEQWKIKLQHRQREAKQTEQALWHWSLSLQAKVLYAWRLWVTEKRMKQEQAARAAQVYRDQLLREGVTRILTYAAHMNDLTTSLTQHGQEQRSRHLQRVVRRCAMRWKQRALRQPRRGEEEVKGQPVKKSVTFCLDVSGSKSVCPSDLKEQQAEDGELSELLLRCLHRCQPRRRKELFRSPLTINQNQWTLISSEETSKPSMFSCVSQDDCGAELPCPPPASVPETPTDHSTIMFGPHMSTVDSSDETHDVLLPPSAFMNTVTEDSRGSGFEDVPHVRPFKQHSDMHLRTSGGETVKDESTDPTSALTRELLGIQLDMKAYQRDRKQLRAWQKLKEVLQSWLWTSGKDDRVEKHAVCQELEELERRIKRLSDELAKRKPSMLLHAERIQRLQTLIQTSGVYYLHQKTEETENLCLQQDRK